MPSLNPVSNVGSQIERAIIAYLKTAYAAAGVPEPNFYYTNDGEARSVIPNGLIDVLASDSAETPTFSNDEDYNVRIRAEWPGANQPNQNDTDFNLTQINQLIGVVVAAMSQTTTGQDRQTTCTNINECGRALATTGTPQEQADNADMVNFTCLKVMSRGSIRATNQEGGLYFHETRRYQIGASPSNVD